MFKTKNLKIYKFADLDKFELINSLTITLIPDFSNMKYIFRSLFIIKNRKDF